jgi:two-component system, cell cycle response regulator
MTTKDDSTTTAAATPQPLATPTSQTVHPCLVVVSGGAIGQHFKLTGEMIIGRADDAQIHLDDDRISRHHAKLQVLADGRVGLVDLGSRNGTYRNGEQISAAFLQDGDKIQIGAALVLKFSHQDELDEALQVNLYQSATRDFLTRLHNRKYFAEALEAEFSFALRHQVPLSVLMIDIDHFKRTNDTHGHGAGDHVLTQVAQQLRECLRNEDILARYGGEEFGVLLRDSDASQSLLCAERIRRKVENRTFEFKGTTIAVTISVGVATYAAGPYDTAEQLFEAADRMLYRAKEAGRNRVEPAPGPP